MPRLKKSRTRGSKKQSSGGFSVEIPVVLLEYCQNLGVGQTIDMEGALTKGGGTSNPIRVTAEKSEDAVKFELLKAGMKHPGLSKLLADGWHCVLSEGELRAQTTPEVDSSNSHNIPEVFPETPQTTPRRRGKRKMPEFDCDPKLTEGATGSPDHIENQMPDESSMKAEEIVPDIDMETQNLSQELFISAEVAEGLGIVGDIPTEDKADVVDEQDQIRYEPKIESDGDTKVIQVIISEADCKPQVVAIKKRGRKRKNFVAARCMAPKKAKVKSEIPFDEVPELIKCRFCGEMTLKTKGDLPGKRKKAGRSTFHECHDCLRNPWSRACLFPKPKGSGKYSKKCEFCPMGFSTKACLNSHLDTCARRPEYMEKFDQVEMGLFICEVCELMCVSSQALLMHRCKEHGFPKTQKVWPDRECKCRYCGESMQNHARRSQHERYRCLSNPNRTKQKKCNVCGYFTYLEEKLQEHMTKHIFQPEEHMCEICGRSFPSHRKLHCHRIRHAEIRTPEHRCPICDKAFTFKQRMVRHMSIHTEVRPVQCITCGKFFKNKSQEAKHRKLLHENRYPFRCAKCGHGMEKECYLKNHVCGRIRRNQFDTDPLLLSDVPVEPSVIEAVNMEHVEPITAALESELTSLSRSLRECVQPIAKARTRWHEPMARMEAVHVPITKEEDSREDNVPTVHASKETYHDSSVNMVNDQASVHGIVNVPLLGPNYLASKVKEKSQFVTLANVTYSEVKPTPLEPEIVHTEELVQTQICGNVNEQDLTHVEHMMDHQENKPCSVIYQTVTESDTIPHSVIVQNVTSTEIKPHIGVQSVPVSQHVPGNETEIKQQPVTIQNLEYASEVMVASENIPIYSYYSM